MDTKFFKPKDIVVIILILFVAFLLYFVYSKFISEKADIAEILYDNNIIKTVNLNENCTFSPEGFPNIVFEVKDNSIAFIHSDCPDKVCINTGFINKTGQSAVCLPNKMVIRLKTKNSNIDTAL